MPAANDVHIIGHLITGHIKMSGRACPAKRGEPPGNAKEKEIRHRAVHIDSELRWVDRDVGGAAVIAPAIESRVERVERSRPEGVVITDGCRLRHFEIAGLSRRQRVLAVISSRILECVYKI